MAYLIAHELLHQWLGDLVTMEWWSDTCLKESFASYFGEYVLEKIGSTLSHSIVLPAVFNRDQKVMAY